jgi:hypothetical protein
VDDQRQRTYNDLQDATEQGACGLAILLVRVLTGQVVVLRSRKGTGFDYWLGEDDDELFSGKTRLEVSGILAGNAGDITARAQEKKGQIAPSSQLGPGYVVVVEFSAPVAHLEKQ